MGPNASGAPGAPMGARLLGADGARIRRRLVLELSMTPTDGLSTVLVRGRSWRLGMQWFLLFLFESPGIGIAVRWNLLRHGTG